MVKCRNEVITECPIRRIRTVSCKACVAHEWCAGRHEPERSECAKCVIKGCGDQIQVLACLFSVESVRAIRGGESGGTETCEHTGHKRTSERTPARRWHDRDAGDDRRRRAVG
jgi:hypothetical protein